MISSYIVKRCSVVLLVIGLSACQTGTDKGKPVVPDSTIARLEKAHNLLTVKSKCAILYEPDTIHIQKWKKKIGKDSFNLAVDNFLFNLNESLEYLKRRHVKVYNTEKHYILFKSNDNSSYLVKTDTLIDPWGIYLFDPDRKPVLMKTDSVETYFKTYFKVRGKAIKHNLK